MLVVLFLLDLLLDSRNRTLNPVFCFPQILLKHPLDLRHER